MAERRRIGWIGLGKMGIPMSRNLIKAGYSLTVYDVIKEKTMEVVGEGVYVADSPKTLAAHVDVMISMIPDDMALKDVSIGPNGAFDGARAGFVYIDMSTTSPIASDQVAKVASEKNIKYLRAPVSGSTTHAASGALTIFASGPKDAYDSCKDIFDTLGQKSFYVGTGEEARYLKLLVNIMVVITSAMTAEALTFGKRAGMDWDQMIDIINNSVVSSPLIDIKVQMLKDRNFTPAATVSEVAKVIDMALDTARALDVPLPVTSLVRQFFSAMKAKGKGELDYFGLITLMEELAGIKL